MMAGLAILSLPSTSHQPKYSLHPCSSPSLNSFSTSSIKLPSKPLSASSPSSSTSVAQADSSPSSDSVPIPSEPPSADLSFSGGCKACGREEVQRGCNGKGRIQGGIATVPGFGWWPIKAYRPCPGFIASGGRYRRSGQSMDEVAFGRTERATAGLGATDQPQSSKEKQRPRKSKR